MSEIIFNFTNAEWKYKGILSAIGDNKAIELEGFGISTPPDFVVEIIAAIWVDENGIWNSRMRLKFPSGSKQVVSMKYDKEEDTNMNETKCLQDLYKFPMKDKYWFKNRCETAQGILDIMRREDLILSETVEKI